MRLRMIIPVLVAVSSVAVLVGNPGCDYSNVDVEEGPPVAEVQETVEPVILVDYTGREWDITTAVHKYGFRPVWGNGIGPYTIKPFINVEMLYPNDLGYPSTNEYFPVIGVSIDGDTRAYNIREMTRNEVADEYVGGVPLAVTY